MLDFWGGEINEANIMNVVDPMVQRLAVAQSALLEPAGLKQSDLARALGCMAEHRVDDADLYFQ